jgi:hypothetical protein
MVTRRTDTGSPTPPAAVSRRLTAVLGALGVVLLLLPGSMSGYAGEKAGATLFREEFDSLEMWESLEFSNVRNVCT